MQLVIVSIVRALLLIIAVFGILFLIWFLYNLCLEGGYFRCRKKSNYSMKSMKSNHKTNSLGLMLVLLTSAAISG
jgi:hypothetical protein